MLSRPFYNFFANFKFAPTYAELEAKVERYADAILYLEDALEDSYDEEVELIDELNATQDIAEALLENLTSKCSEVLKLKEELKEVNAKLNFIKGVVCN